MRTSRPSDWRTNQSPNRRRRFTSSWLFTLLVVIGLFLIQHRSVPDVPFPAHYVKVGQEIRIPLRLASPTGTGENWLLAKIDNQSYAALVTVGGRTLHQYAVTSHGVADSTGVTYTTKGNINLENTLYHATYIHVNQSGQTGYVQLSPANTPASSTSGSGTANAPSGNVTAP